MNNHYTTIWDLDGTLSDCSARLHLVKNKQYEAFHSCCFEDPVRKAEAEIFQRVTYTPGHLSVIMTGRPDNYREETEEWLRKHDLIWDILIMRRKGNHDPSVEFKKRSTLLLREEGHTILFAVEDRPVLVQMFLDLGIPVLQSHQLGSEG